MHATGCATIFQKGRRRADRNRKYKTSAASGNSVESSEQEGRRLEPVLGTLKKSSEVKVDKLGIHVDNLTYWGYGG